MKMKNPNRKEKWVPDDGQKIAVKYLLEHAAAGLLLDPGFGKTAITLAAFSFLKREGIAERMLVIAPKRVAQLTWPEEVAKWENFRGLTIEFVHGAKKEEILWSTKADVVVTNFESLAWLYDITKVKHSRGFSVKVNKRRAKKLAFDTVCIDELSKVKHHGSGRHKILKEVTGLFQRRWGLTGSIAANGLMGLFGQCLILDEGRTFGRYITHFRREYFDKEEYGYAYNLKPGAEERIYKRMAPLCLRLDEKQQGTKIPDLVSRVRHIALPEGIRRMYDEMESDLLTMVDEKVVTAKTSAVASMKLRQICSGGVYVEDGLDAILKKHKVPAAKKRERKWIDLHNEKFDALEEMMDELEGQPMLVAYDFRFTLAKIKDKFPEAGLIAGGTKDDDAAKFKQAWLAGDLQYLFVHPQAAAHGLNLQHWGESFPRHVCWLDPIWDFEGYDQLNRRVRRRGNKMKRVFAHHILARDTLEDRMLSVLSSKRRTQNALHDAILELNRLRHNF